MEISTSKTERFFTWLPVVIFCSIVPLIVYTKHMRLNAVVSEHWMGFEQWGDLFAFCKAYAIIACGIIALVMLVIKAARGNIKTKFIPAYAGLLLYFVLTLLSSVFSKYPSVAFFGAPERFEGALVLFSYIIMFFYITIVFKKAEHTKYIVVPLIISSSAILLIAALQFFGLDIYRLDFIKRLLNMLPTDDFPYKIEVYLRKYSMYSTVFNPNYLGLYLTMLIPVVLAYYASKNKASFKASVTILVYLCFLSLIGSGTTGSYYAMGLTLLIMAVLGFRHFRFNLMSVFLMIIAVAVMLLMTDLVTGNRLYRQFANLDTVSEAIETAGGTSKIYIDDIILSMNSVILDTTLKDFKVTNLNKTITVTDLDGKDIPIHIYDEGDQDVFPGNIIYFDEPGYEDYVITTNPEYSVFAIRAGIKTMYFYMTDEGIKVPGVDGKLYDIPDVERNEFFYKYGNLFSGRGYIWAGMLPNLKSTVLLGHGPDTFFITYPQDDFIGKVNQRGTHAVMVEKGHSFYFQVAHDSGWLALLSLLFIFGWYFIETIVLLVKKKITGPSRKYAVAVFCAAAGYLLSSVIYDSMVHTAPVFWTLLAMGFALNAFYKNKPLAPEKE